MGLFSNIGQNLRDISSGKRSFASLFNGGVNPTAPQGPQGGIITNPAASYRPGTYQTPAAPIAQNNSQPTSSNYNLNGVTYNQSGDVVPNSQPASQNQQGGQVQASAQNLQPANINNNQTFGFGGDPGRGLASTSFANYSPSTNQVQTDVTSGGTPNIQSKLPGNTTDSTSLGAGPTNGDINSALSKNSNTANNIFGNLNTLYNQQQQAASNIQSAGQVSPEEKTAQGQVSQAQLGVGQQQQQVASLQAQAGGAYNPSGNPDLAFVTGAARNAIYTAQQGLLSSQLQQQLAETNLAYQQGNRQVAFNTASKVFDATRNNLSDMLNLYTATAPKSINTNYNPATGNLTLTMQSPITGETFNKVQNIGPQKSLEATGSPFLDPNSGNYLQSFLQNGNTPVLIPLTGPHQGQVLQGENGAGGIQGNQPGTPNGLGSVSIPGYGAAVNPQTNSPWRTDANNNPIAAAVTTGGSNQFTKALDQAGVPWTYGSAFKDNSKMSTIKILGDPIEGARAILAGSNAIQGWYSTSTGSSVLKQYGIQNNAQFAASSTQTQNAIIDGIYKTEVGSGILTHPQNEQPIQGQSSQTQQNYQSIVQAAPLSVQTAFKQAPDGSAYLDTSFLSDPQSQIAARAFINHAAQSGVHIQELNADEVKSVQAAQKSLANLQLTASNFAQLADSNGAAAKGRAISDPFLKFFGSARGDLVKSYTSNRDTLFQQINTLAGSSPRLNTNELNIAQTALPQVSSFNADTLNQGLDKLAITQSALTNSVKTFLPNYTAPALQINGQYWVHASDGKNYFFPNQEVATQFKKQTNTP